MQKFIEDNLEIILKFRQELSKETDRGCALMAASFLDYTLEKTLRDKLVGNKNHLDRLFDFNGPLGTFSSRIKLSYSIGLIPKEIMNDLDLIRKVRNEFGHKYEPITFDTPLISNWLNNLKTHYFSKGEGRPRGKFTNTVLGVLAFIHTAEIQKKKFEEATFIPRLDEFKAKTKDLRDKITSVILQELKKTEDKD